MFCTVILVTHEMEEAFEIKDVLEVGRWLQQKGFPRDVIDSFEGEFDLSFFLLVLTYFFFT